MSVVAHMLYAASMNRVALPFRRKLLGLALGLPVFGACAPSAVKPGTEVEQLAVLEARSGGRLGVCLIDGASGENRLLYRAGERFPMCSTFKLMLAGAVLAKAVREPGLLESSLPIAATDLVNYSPLTEKRVGAGMSVEELCRAALQYSDNTAANLLIRLLGEPASVTAFARSIGDGDFRLDRWETELNSAVPGDVRDTTTPAAMAASLRALGLGEALPIGERRRLDGWLQGNTTGGKRIRAGLPAGWSIGDKTGSGDYGTTNDIAILRSPRGQSYTLAVYFTQPRADAKWADSVVATAASIAVRNLG